MGVECAYGFNDLYKAAHGTGLPKEVSESLFGCTQEERNRRVADWARKAGWQTESRIGSDGVEYLAFCPDFGGKR